MKIKITYKVCGMTFEAIANNIYEAYKYVEAIIKANAVNFPCQEETLSEYMCYLADMKNGETIKHSNYIFSMEIIREEKS